MSRIGWPSGMVSAFPGSGGCGDAAQVTFHGVDTGSDGVIDGQKQVAFNIDLTPPPVPEKINVAPGNEAVVVSWNAVDFTTNQDLQGYQILCRRGADLQVFKDDTFKAYYQTCQDTTKGFTGAGAVGIEELNPLFACSPLLTRSTTSFVLAQCPRRSSSAHRRRWTWISTPCPVPASGSSGGWA